MRLRQVFSKNLKRIRTELGVSQDTLSQKTGLTKSKISTFENHDSNPTIDTLEKIADALNVRASELLQEKPEKGFKDYARFNSAIDKCVYLLKDIILVLNGLKK